MRGGSTPCPRALSWLSEVTMPESLHEHRFRFLRPDNRLLPGHTKTAPVDIFYCEVCLHYAVVDPSEQVKDYKEPSRTPFAV